MEYSPIEGGTSGVYISRPKTTQAQEWLQQAEASIAQGQYQTAGRQLMQADLAMLALSETERSSMMLTARAFWLQGLIYFSRHLMEEAKQELLLAREQLLGREDGRLLLAEVMGRLGNISHLQSHAEEAISYYQQSSELASAVSAHHIAVKAYNNIGNIHLGLGEVAEAKSCYERGLEAAHRSEDPAALARAYRTLAVLHANYGPFSEALDFAGRALAACQHVLSQETRAIISSEAAIVYVRMGDGELAVNYLQHAYARIHQDGSRMAQEMVAIAVAELWHTLPTAGTWTPNMEAAIIHDLEEATEQPLLRSEAMRRLSQFYMQRDDKTRARHCLNQVQTLNTTTTSLSRDDKAIIAHTLATLLAFFEDESASAYFDLAVALLEQADLSPYQLSCVWQDYARFHYQHGALAEAKHAAEQATAIRRQIGLEQD